MIRQPTTPETAREWWNRALRDPSTPRVEDEPQVGFYRMRKVKNGPWLPVKIYLHQVTDENGELTEPETIEVEVNGWPEEPDRVWTYCKPITEADFDALNERHRIMPAMNEVTRKYDISETPILPQGY